jgi:hypothetical protein
MEIGRVALEFCGPLFEERAEWDIVSTSIRKYANCQLVQRKLPNTISNVNLLKNTLKIANPASFLKAVLGKPQVVCITCEE